MKKIIKYYTFFILCLFSLVSYVKAESGSIKVSSSSSKVVVGKTFNVTVTVSGDVALGTYEYTLNYDSNLVKLTSGSAYNVWYPSNSSTKSNSKTFTFKAVGSGTSTISVKSYNVLGYTSEASLSTSARGATIKTMTQAELQASYSKNNDLSSLSVEGAQISPQFNKDTTEYTVELGANTTSITIDGKTSDGAAHVNGLGTFDVTEGENKFDIVVTAENGNEKTYTLIANVIDPNPIKVNVDGKELVVVKRASVLTKPETYTETIVKINDVDIPGFTSEITKYNLVGLKDANGNIELYIYNNNNYIKYNEFSFNKLSLYIIEGKNIPDGYEKTSIKIGDIDTIAYKNEDSNFYLVYGMNIETGKEDWYQYDTVESTVSRYNRNFIDSLNKKLNNFKLIIIFLCVETLILFLIILSMCIKRKKKKNSYVNNKVNEEKEVTHEKEVIEDKEVTHEKEVIEEKKIADNKDEVNEEKEVIEDRTVVEEKNSEDEVLDDSNDKKEEPKEKKKRRRHKDPDITQIFDEL